MSKFERLRECFHESLTSVGLSQSPVIVLSMHRSGSTMLAKILRSAGIFMGMRLSGNLEPRILQDTNRQIFDYFGASWLDAHLLPNQQDFNLGFNGLATSVIERFNEDFIHSFVGKNKLTSSDWGFKEPRMSITAGLFLRIFPDARAIHIIRNPLNVALSIVAREKKIRRKYPGNEKDRKSVV